MRKKNTITFDYLWHSFPKFDVPIKNLFWAQKQPFYLSFYSAFNPMK
jgi:hypothetical protein